MNKLVIHPKDRTTDFLKPIYHGRNDTTVLTGGCTKQEVEQAIDKHDHIIMLGHGTPQGLLAMNQFNGKRKPSYKPSEIIRSAAGSKPVTSEQIKDFYAQPEDDWFQGRSVGATSYQYGAANGNLTNGYVIDDLTTGKLDGKKLTAIWCNADQYMEWNDLEGFYTGMFISDEGEAKMIGVSDTEAWQVEESNYAFVSVVRRFIDHSPEKLRDALMLEYGEMAERNAVAKYNLMRFYTRKAAQGQLVTA